MGTSSAMSNVGALITPFVAQVSDHLSWHFPKCSKWVPAPFLHLAFHILGRGSRCCSGHRCMGPCHFTVALVCWAALHPWSCPLRHWERVCRSPVLIRIPETRWPPEPESQMIQRRSVSQMYPIQDDHIYKKGYFVNSKAAVDATVACSTLSRCSSPIIAHWIQTDLLTGREW